MATQSIPKRRRRSPMILCDDLLAESLLVLPHKTVIKFQAVSKSWGALIQSRVLSQWLPRSILGFFYRRSGITRPLFHPTGHTPPTPILDFLPEKGFFKIADCCNGLVLYQQCSPSGRQSEHYCVCNPHTKQLQPMPFSRGLGNFTCHAYLAYDPRVSPHYKVLLLRVCDGLLSYYSSKTHMLSTHKVFEGLLARRRRQGTFCEGAMYVAGKLHIARFDLDKEDYRAIGYPNSTAKKKPSKPRGRLGQFGGRVCYAEIRQFKLLVWTLGEGDKWSVKHNAELEGVGAVCVREGSKRWMPRITAFHPHSDALFLMSKNRIVEYNLESMSVKGVWDLGHGSGEVITTTLFPFSPCSLEYIKV